ncbi:MAG: helix-turn-helix domain-containing protein, partial [Microterricola sp.]
MSPSRRPLPSGIGAISALDDPARRALYELITGSAESIGRDAAATALGLSRSTTAFHLDRLADAGLLSVEFRRISGKTGPGSGRPAKLYRRAPGELSVSLPARHYDLAGELMAEAIG